MTEGFDPARHLTRVNGSDYLEVRWRLVWLRDQHPDAVLATECLYADDKMARFLCRITLPSGASASGHGSETSGDFRDFYEKSETKAIGRALAALGFGTQFCPDHEFGAAVGRVVDAPVKRQRGSAEEDAQPSRPQPPDTAPGHTRGPVTQPQGQTGGITPEQIRHSTSMAEELGVVLDDRVAADFNKGSLSMLTQSEGAKLVQDLRKEVTEHRAATKQQPLQGTERGQSFHHAP